MLAGSFVRFFGNVQAEQNSGSPLDWAVMRQIAEVLSRSRAKAAETEEAPTEAVAPRSITPGIPGSLERYRRQIAALEAQALADWTEAQRQMAAQYELEQILRDAEAMAAFRLLRNRLDEEALILILANL